MNDSTIAWLQVKAVKAIIQNAQTKEQADRAMKALNPNLLEMMRLMSGYEELPA